MEPRWGSGQARSYRYSSLFGMILWQDAMPWSAWLAMALITLSGILATSFQHSRAATLDA